MAFTKSATPFYELVFIIRQDAASSDVDKITNDFKKIIESNDGSIIKTEYWGFRTLTYKIKNNKKGHYVFLGITATPKVITQLKHEVKLRENVIRFFTVNVKEISKEPSPILKSQAQENESIVDVTINKKSA